MENSKNSQVEKHLSKNCEDLRQSNEWGSFLKSIGWIVEETSKGHKIYIRKTGIINVLKVQRPENLDNTDLIEIEEIAKKHKAAFIKIEPELNQDLELLKQNGFRTSNFPMLPPATIIVNLKKSGEELWSQISRSGKYSINRAKREGVIIEIYKNPSDEIFDVFFQVAADTANQKKFYIENKKTIKKRADLFGDKAFIAIAKNPEGDVLATNLYLTHKKGVWYMQGGTTQKARKGKAGYELVWQVILGFKKLGFEFLDFEGIGDDRFPVFTKNWSGLTHFKEKFSKNYVYFPYPQVKLLSRFLKLAEKIYGKIPL